LKTFNDLTAEEIELELVIEAAAIFLAFVTQRRQRSRK